MEKKIGGYKPVKKYTQWLENLRGAIIETLRLIDCIGLGMYREWKKIEFPKGYYI